MNKPNSEVIISTADYVKQSLAGIEGSHDWWHIYRVWKLSLKIARAEAVDIFVVQLGALLHDMADPKIFDGDEESGLNNIGHFLKSKNLDDNTAEQVMEIVTNISFRNRLEVAKKSKELEVVQDADRLDALGAIGIARTFSYGGSKGRLLYDPGMEPRLNMSKAEYQTSNAPSINHFYEKLLLLKGLMNTKTATAMAERRHQFIEKYLQEFYGEWEGNY